MRGHRTPRDRGLDREFQARCQRRGKMACQVLRVAKNHDPAAHGGATFVRTELIVEREHRDSRYRCEDAQLGVEQCGIDCRCPQRAAAMNWIPGVARAAGKTRGYIEARERIV